jgi:radical SAM family protein
MKTLLITPPMTQLNTPYPATAYLSGFLQQQGYQTAQRDFAIELLLQLLSRRGMNEIYGIIEERYESLSDDELPDAIFHFFSHYETISLCIQPCIRFLQGKDPSLAMRIASRIFLPEGPQFESLYQMEATSGDVLDIAFGQLGVQDKAKYLATLFLNDVIAAISEGVDSLFSASRYGDRLAASNPSFDDIYQQLQAPFSYVRSCLHELTVNALQQEQPNLLVLTVPFPGNLLGALQIAASCKQLFPHCKIVLGGGYVNTELRTLSEPRIFEFVDFITLDDGERPLLTLLEHLKGDRDQSELFRTYCLQANHVHYYPAYPALHDFPHSKIGTPTYVGLNLNHYLSLCEMLNPMHRIWSDARWNKLTVAHGCYWKKCSFCDISLSYIGHYDEAGAAIIADRIEALIAETGQRGFHFVDEAAPPKVLFALAQTLLNRQIVISWWGNIRFEKTFTAEKCQLLADSGCIAVSGGLEVASDRLLKLMKKGVSIEQVARVTRHFADAGILVHAYLMYGFPTQTEAETVESLEMVRQMMLHGCFQSAYWHRFAATIHSPVGQHPEQYNIELIANEPGRFAENDIHYIDPVAADHELLGQGLKKALYNYMHGMGFEHPVDFWFDKTVNQPTISPDFIEQALS